MPRWNITVACRTYLALHEGRVHVGARLTDERYRGLSR